MLVLSVLLVPVALTPAVGACTSFNAYINTILVECNNTDFQTVALENPTRIINEGNGVFVVNSIVLVDANKTLNIKAPGVSYIKITGGNGLEGEGSMYLDGVKVTSWDTASQSVVQQNFEGSVIRAWVVGATGTGVLDIRNSELGYLGYAATKRQGVAWYNSNGRLLDSTIHHNFFGMYGARISNFLAERNELDNNIMYGFDPHTAAHDSTFRENNITNTRDGAAMVCSLDCYNIRFEYNYIENQTTGILLSKNMSNSIVRGNTIIGTSATAISVADSANNLIENNHIYNSTYGITVKTLRPHYATGHNGVVSNDLHNIAKQGIWIRPGTSYNIVLDNFIENADPALLDESPTTLLYNNTVIE